MPAVEPVLRRALAKKTADRFPSIKDFARAFETAATGRQRELTPAPIEVSRPPVARETVGYAGAVEAAPSALVEVKDAAPTQPDGVPEEVLPTRRYSADDLARGLAMMRWRRIYLVAAGVGLGWIDAHLLAAAVLQHHLVWTADLRFGTVAAELGVAYQRVGGGK